MIFNYLRSRGVGRHRPWRIGAVAVLAVWTAAIGIRSDGVQAAPPPRQSAPAPSLADQSAIFTRYCLTCHNQRLKERGTVPVALDTLDLANVGADAEAWEKVVLKVRA